ncbi:MAG: hypothetical protein JWL81_228 [Verrucomicrobiales bacterium]|nr:hypothetical protein [Verrucomicrobiales bacterium]
MIPNLKDLPPIEEEPHPIRKLLKPALGLIIMLVCCGGLIYFYMNGLQKAATQETQITEGLQSIGADLWLKGGAREIKTVDPDLITELARLRGKVGLDVKILALSADPGLGTGGGTHQLVYTTAKTVVITIQLFVDPTENRVDILGWTTNPEFQDRAALR